MRPLSHSSQALKSLLLASPSPRYIHSHSPQRHFSIWKSSITAWCLQGHLLTSPGPGLPQGSLRFPRGSFTTQAQKAQETGLPMAMLQGSVWEALEFIGVERLWGHCGVKVKGPSPIHVTQSGSRSWSRGSKMQLRFQLSAIFIYVYFFFNFSSFIMN